jgi:hypothetical protein
MDLQELRNLLLLKLLQGHTTSGVFLSREGIRTRGSSVSNGDMAISHVLTRVTSIPRIYNNDLCQTPRCPFFIQIFEKLLRDKTDLRPRNSLVIIDAVDEGNI